MAAVERLRGREVRGGAEIIPPRDEQLVVLESMPQQHRSSHRAAHNFGIYPHNGSHRYVMPRVEAQEVVASDEDGYDHIVRAATKADIEHLEYESAGVALPPGTKRG